MKNILIKSIVIIGVFLVGLVVGASGLWFIAQNNIELRYYLLEHATVNQPQAQVAPFVQAIVQGDRTRALELWEIYNPETKSELTTRRETVISDLINAGISPDYQVLEVEWWGTCCEPSVICDSRSAGGARLRVQFIDPKGQPMLYIFDIFAREQPYCGAAMGYPPREWVIRDVYPFTEEPLFWKMHYECQVHSLLP